MIKSIRVPRFLFEEEDILSIQAVLKESLKKDAKWIYFSRRDMVSLKAMLSKNKLTMRNGFMVDVVGRTVGFWYEAKSLGEKISCLGLILSLKEFGEDLPRKLLEALEE